MKFIERYPNYCDFGPPQEYEINSLDELYTVDRVHDAVDWPDFFRLSCSPEHEFMGGFRFLIAETNNGEQWWVIGRFDEPYDEWINQLPVWKHKNE